MSQPEERIEEALRILVIAVIATFTLCAPQHDVWVEASHALSILRGASAAAIGNESIRTLHQ